jgi:D-lactate dehydrogenase
LENVQNIKEAEGIVVFIYSTVNKEVLDQLPNLKYIATMSTGFDHIDIEECKKRNIVVSTVPTYGENTVAEHAFALIFAISRRLIESVERVKDGNFSPIGLTGFDLFGRTLGVIGVGNIGIHAIRIAKGIGMEVVAYKRTPDPKLATDLGFRFVSMDELYNLSDIITIHVPYSKETHHLLNDDAFSKMKDGVIIINTARGALIDTTSLVNAIQSKKVAAAGLDVLCFAKSTS